MTASHKPAEPVRLCRECKWAEDIEAQPPWGIGTWEAWHNLLGTGPQWEAPRRWFCGHPTSHYSAHREYPAPGEPLVTGEPLPHHRTIHSCAEVRVGGEYHAKKYCGAAGRFWEPRE